MDPTRTTIQEVITSRIKEKNLSRHQLVAQIGYTNISKGLRRLDRFLSSLDAPEEFVHKLIRLLEIDPVTFHTAMANSSYILEKKANNERKERFSPFIKILINFTPRPIFVYHYVHHHCVTSVPIDIQNLPFSEELSAVYEIYENHLNALSLERFSGSLLQYLRPTRENNELFRNFVSGFHYHRSHDHYFHFSRDFRLLKIELKSFSIKATESFGNKVMGMIVRTMEGK